MAHVYNCSVKIGNDRQIPKSGIPVSISKTENDLERYLMSTCDLHVHMRAHVCTHPQGASLHIDQNDLCVSIT